jgi:hypothetical protein
MFHVTTLAAVNDKEPRSVIARKGGVAVAPERNEAAVIICWALTGEDDSAHANLRGSRA